MTYKILNTLGSTFAPKAKEVLDTLGNVDYKHVTQDEFLRIVPRYDIIVVGIQPIVNKEAIDKASRLKIIVVPANTLENIDVEYAESQGIAVVSLWGETKFLNTITGTAELALGLMISIVRFLPWAFGSVKEYKWKRELFRGTNLYGKTIGIIGMGRLGTWMAKYGRSLGMDVIFYDPHTKKSIVPGSKKVSLSELLKASDVISLHAHLNKETENMLNADAFKKMKKGVYIVNTARGRIVDEKALLHALKGKRVAGYATDVLADEFEVGVRLRGYPLLEYAKKHSNVIIVPHIGGVTRESRERTDEFVVEKLKKILKKKRNHA
ncbi:MAG: 3-phosphoglycerate dehydrogenase [Parcubacteria group bacterium]|nr:3-phosphoglycerate dehydrogenase [Parcubacteria group bacterium]